MTHATTRATTTTRTVPDGDLLERYTTAGDQAAFGELVGRHVEWVYSAARRVTGDPSLAEDVAQGVFLALAQKAGKLRGHPSVAGWLFRATRFAANAAVRRRRRREIHEANAMEQKPDCADRADAYWDDVKGRLEDAVAGLRGEDRQAILLRFYQQLSHAEVGAALGIGQEAARKRVERALGKLRGRLGGVGDTGVLSAALVAHAVGPAPAVLKTAMVTTSTGPGAAAIAKGVNTMLAWTQAKMVLAAAVVLVVVPATVGVAVKAAWGQAAPTTAPAARGPAPFTVGKNTTAIASPLRADGTVDYIAALNERYGKGVTPENNGFVVWVDVMGADEIRPEWREQMLKLAGVKSPKAKGWEGYTDGKLSGLEVKRRDAEVSVAQRHLWKAADHPQLAAFLKDRERLLALATEAAAKPRWWEPAASKNETMMWVLLPELQSMRDVSNTLWARAMLRAGEGDFDGFVSDVSTIKRMSRAAAGWTGVGHLVAAGLDDIANTAIGIAVGSGVFPAGHCAKLGKALDELPPISPATELVDLGERWAVLDVVACVATRKTGQMYTGDPGPAQFARSLEKVDVGEVDWDAAMRLVNSVQDERLAAVKKMLPEDRLAARAELRKRIAGLNRTPTGSLAKAKDETREAYTKRVTGRLLAGMGNLDRVDDRLRRAEIQDQMARAVVAAGQYRAEKGQWPE
jgi:RNA polymerase sigma factor (sigma-70 family)